MADAAKMPRPFTATEERIARPIIRVMSLVNTWIYRWSGGRFGAVWMHGAPILLLTTVDFAGFVGIPIPEDLASLRAWHARVSARPSAAA